MQVVMASEGRPVVDRVLDEVEHHIKRLDQCVARMAEQMERTNNCDELARLAGDALDANKNATTLQELRMLLMEQKRSEGGENARTHTHKPANDWVAGLVGCFPGSILVGGCIGDALFIVGVCVWSGFEEVWGCRWWIHGAAVGHGHVEHGV